ncbi:MAG TPA: FAD-binding protein, partial [Longimicrobiales bacterium]|nr:FAD-binding protein [Longimicrobiales bacterium]
MAGYERHEYDVLVIGAGGAGLRAAVEASGAGANVGVVCKSLLGKAHTVMAEGGIAASLANVDERDSWKVHFADTMRGGQYLNDWRMAELHARESPARVRELEAWGALFDRTDDGRILQRNFGGHAYPRLAHVGDRTGLDMIRALQDHGIHQGMDVHMEVTVTRLLKDGDRVAGAFAYDRERGRFRVFRAAAVILATGGIGRAYRITSNSWEYTGDGHTLAYDAGAELMDMEFVQFHPTGMVWPPSVRGTLVTEGVRGEGGILTNSEGRRFLFDDIPAAYRDQTADTEEEGWRYCRGDPEARRPPELLTRDHVARCILKEVAEGRGSPHGGAFLDIAWIKERVPGGAEHIKRKLPGMYHQFKELAEIDITETPMEVGPTTHYVMGGIRVNPETQMSTLPGLFAAGECAAGLHGANRLGGNSLSDLLVFGRRAGKYAAEYANEKGRPTVDQGQVEGAVRDALAPLERTGSDDDPGPFKVLQTVQE